MTSIETIATCGATKTTTTAVTAQPVPASLLTMSNGPSGWMNRASLINDDTVLIPDVPIAAQLPAGMTAAALFFSSLARGVGAAKNAEAHVVFVVGSGVKDQYDDVPLNHLPSGHFPAYQQSSPPFVFTSLTKLRSMEDSPVLKAFIEDINATFVFRKCPLEIDHVFATKLRGAGATEKMQFQSSDLTQLAPGTAVLLLFLGGRFEVQFRRSKKEQKDNGGLTAGASSSSSGGCGKEVITVTVGSCAMLVIGPETTATMEYSIAAVVAPSDNGIDNDQFVLTMRQVDVDSYLTRKAAQKLINASYARQVSSQKKRNTKLATELEQLKNSPPSVVDACVATAKKRKTQTSLVVDDGGGEEEVIARD